MSNSIPHFTRFSSSSSGAFAQVIRVAHSGVRSSCRVDLGFVGFLLIWWFLRRLFLGFLYFLQISFHSWFFHTFFRFWCILGWCVLGFLYSLCRTCTGWYFPDLFCNFLSPLSLMLWLWALHCIVFCLVCPCILVFGLLWLLFSTFSSDWLWFSFLLHWLFLQVFSFLFLFLFAFWGHLWVGLAFVHIHEVLSLFLLCVPSMCCFRGWWHPLLGFFFHFAYSFCLEYFFLFYYVLYWYIACFIQEDRCWGAFG